VKGTSPRPGFQEIKYLFDARGNKRIYQRILETALTDSSVLGSFDNKELERREEERVT
jgi:hypothetical protein